MYFAIKSTFSFLDEQFFFFRRAKLNLILVQVLKDAREKIVIIAESKKVRIHYRYHWRACSSLSQASRQCWARCRLAAGQNRSLEEDSRPGRQPHKFGRDGIHQERSSERRFPMMKREVFKKKLSCQVSQPT